MTETVKYAYAGRRPQRGIAALFWIGCFALPIALFCATAAWGGVYPFGGESFLTEDLKYQYIDFFTWYRGVLTGEHSIFYSFAQGLGSNTWGLYSYYLASPFNLLIMLFSEEHLTLAIFIITGLKLGCIGLAMGFFLRRRFELPYAWSLLFAVSFAFSGWVVTQLRNPMWLDALILLPLGALACWRLIRTGRFLALSLVVAADIICCWYTAYMSVLFFCLYVLLELAVHIFIGNRAGARFVLCRAVRFTAALILGLALSAWTFVPTVLAMLGGSGGANMTGIFACTPTELAKSLFPGLWAYGTPQFYTGLVALIAAVLFLLNARIPLRLRVIVFIIAGFMVASAVLKPLQYVWCGFRAPNGFYSRTAILASFTMVWMAAYCVRRGWQAPWQHAADEPEHAANALPHARDARGFRLTRCRPAVLALLALTVVELAVNAHLSWNQLYVGYPQEEHEAYVNEADAQLEALRAFDDSAFYRMDKTYTRNGAALNEGIARNFMQLSSYSSANNPHAIDLLNTLGYSSKGEFSTRYSAPILASDALLGVRYAATFEKPAGYLATGLPATSNGAMLYENPYALSLGFVANAQAANVAHYKDMDPFAAQNAIFRAFSGVEEDLYTPLAVEQVTSTDGTPSWNVAIPEGAIGYAYVQESPEDDVQTPVVLTIGTTPYQENTRFEHSLRPLNTTTDTASVATVTLAKDATAEPSSPTPTCLFYGLDLDALARCCEVLGTSQMNVTQMGDSVVSGTVTTAEAGDLVLSIPYDRGWTATVNGEICETEPVLDGGMMSFHLKAGENDIRLSFRSPGLRLGSAISLAGVAVFALYVLFGAIARRRSRA